MPTDDRTFPSCRLQQPQPIDAIAVNQRRAAEGIQSAAKCKPDETYGYHGT